MASELERLQAIQERIAAAGSAGADVPEGMNKKYILDESSNPPRLVLKGEPDSAQSDEASRLLEIQRRVREQPQPSEGMLSDFGRGARRNMAQNIVEGPGGAAGLLQKYVTDPAMALVGKDMPAEREALAQRYQKQSGINPHAKPATYSEAFGEAAPGAIRDAAGMIALGPGLAAVEGPGIIARIIRGVGEFATTRPVGTVAGGLTAIPGAQLGGEFGGAGGEIAGEKIAGETGGEVGRAVGGFTGSLIGGVATGMPGQAFGSRLPGSGGFGGPRMVRTEMGNIKRVAAPPSAEPFLEAGTNPQGAQQFALQQADRMRISVDNDIDRTVENVSARIGGNRMSPNAVSEEFSTALRQLEREQSAIVNGMWERAHVHDATPIDTTGVLRAAAGMEPLLETNPAVVPQGTLNRLFNLGTHMVQGERAIRPISLREMLELRSSILQDERVAAAGNATTAPNSGLARNLRQLDTAIMDAIQPHSALPEVGQAIEASRIFSDRFRRSNIADLLGEYRTGADRVAPEDAIRWLLQRNRAPRDLMEAGEQLTANTPSPRSGPLDPANTTRSAFQLGTIREYQDIAQRVKAQGAVHNPETAGRKGAEAAVGFGQKIERNIQDYAQAEGMISRSNQLLMDSVNKLNAFEKSAFNQFAQRTDPETGIRSLLNGKDPKGDVQELLARMRSPIQAGGRSSPSFSRADQPAIDGLKTGLVEELRREGGGNMMKTYELFQRPRYKNVLDVAFSPDELSRMDRMLRLMVGAERGDLNSVQRLLQTGAATAAGVIGVTTGGIASKVLGFGAAYGSLAYPAAFKRLFMNNVQKMFSQEGADKLFTKALYDQRFEQTLMAKIPTVWREAAGHSRRLGALTAAIQSQLDRGQDAYKAAGKAAPKPTSNEYGADGRRVLQLSPDEASSREVIRQIDGMGEYPPGARESPNVDDRRGFFRGRLLDLFRDDGNYDQGPAKAPPDSSLEDVSRTFQEGLRPVQKR